MLIDVLKTILLGIIEGITEWLPISSTGHLIIAEDFLKPNITPQFWEMFEVVIQLGAILAVIAVFFGKLNPFSPKKQIAEKKATWSMWFKVVVACLPAAVIGLLFDDKIDELFYNSITVAIMLIVYGVFFILLENRNKNAVAKINSFEELDYKTALLIGGFQVLALIPGTSRSGATILGALLLGCSRYIAAEFSFFLAIPVMFGASGLKLVKFITESGAMSSKEMTLLFIGMIVSFAVSVFAIKFLMDFIKKHDFKSFGYYRIVLGVVLIIYYLCTR